MPDVRVTTVEVNAHHASVAHVNFAHAGVSDRLDVRVGPGIEVLPQLAEEVKVGKRPKI